jgi:Domain of unknown function (DUF4398)
MRRRTNGGIRATLGMAAAAAVCGCASAPMHDVMLGERAIARAQAAGAAEHAPAELALAQEKLALGKRWIAARDFEPAKWLAEQARVDAELAGMKAASAVARREAVREAAAFRAATLHVVARQER